MVRRCGPGTGELGTPDGCRTEAPIRFWWRSGSGSRSRVTGSGARNSLKDSFFAVAIPVDVQEQNVTILGESFNSLVLCRYFINTEPDAESA